MNLPMPGAFAQDCAQGRWRVESGFCPRVARANVPLPALVPSFIRAGGNVTCYPSPLKRPVGIDGGPSFYESGSRHHDNNRDEVRETCRDSRYWRLAFLSWRACPAACARSGPRCGRGGCRRCRCGGRGWQYCHGRRGRRVGGRGLRRGHAPLPLGGTPTNPGRSRNKTGAGVFSFQLEMTGKVRRHV